MKTLIVLFGQVRTLASCIHSIYDKILLTNRPCQVLLAIDGKYQDIPKEVLDLLNPYLLDIYVTHNKEDVQRQDQIIEFFLVAKALERVNLEDFTFILKIRTDIYLRYPIDIKVIYGMCSPQQFEKSFLAFCHRLKIDWKEQFGETLKSYFLTACLDFFIPRQLHKEQPPRSPWSTNSVYDWNAKCFEAMDKLCTHLKEKKGTVVSTNYAHQLIRKLSQDLRVMYLIGSTWIHFGYANDVARVSQLLVENHTNLKKEGVEDEEELEWTDHKNEVRTKTHKEWRKITDDQIRMVHHLYGYALMDLVNGADYIESFDATSSLQINKKRPELFAWIVRANKT